MPIIIYPAAPAPNFQTLTHVATAKTFPPTQLLHVATAKTFVTRSLAHVARAYTRPRPQVLTHTAIVSAPRVATLTHVGTAFTGPQATPVPVVVRPGAPKSTTTVQSSYGNVLSVSYTHSGTRESMTMTVAGAVLPSGTLDLQVSEMQGATVSGSLSIVLDADPYQYEVQNTPTGVTTVLHGENHNATRLGSVRCAELIPWHVNPTPLPDRRVPCAARPPLQTTSVSGVVSEAFKAAGMTASFPAGDPLTGEQFKERERDYTTLGKTPDTVFGDTYGQLGWTYMVSGKIAAILPPNATIQALNVQARELRGDYSTRGEAQNTPALLTMTGADLLLPAPSLIALAVDAPDTQSLYREASSDYDWYITTATPDGETIKGFRKTAGQMTFTNELTRSDVTVKETVDGVEQTRVFSGVVTGYTSTSTTYDPYCTDAAIYQQTVKTSYGYGLNTETHLAVFSGPGWGGSYSAGDILANERQTISQTFSPEGYLSSKVTTTTKLVSLTQEGADGPLANRGPLVAKEYVTQILSEAYQPVGGGKWLRLWSLSGGQQLPLYDTGSGDAVRLASRGGTFNNGQEVLDQAPAQVSCPDPCGIKTVSYPQIEKRTMPDGREGQEQTRSLPFVVSRSRLAAYASSAAALLAPSTVTEFTLATVRDFRPRGTKLTGVVTGWVESFTVEASHGTATVKTTIRDYKTTANGKISQAEGDGPFRDMVIWRLPGGVEVNHLTGVSDSGEPIFQRIYVRATGANLPAPGDEIEWRNDTRFGPTATGNYGN